MQILIADDDAISRLMLATILRKAGFDPREVENGTDAWSIMQQPDAPRLVILDWMMPGLDGIEVLQKIRRATLEKPPYVIMLTARMEKEEIIKGLDAGANDYLTKPFNSGELQARVGVGRRMVELQEELIRSREELAFQASHDHLTGLFNRRAALERLHLDLARVRRESGAVHVALCDVDHFKAVNDNHGHQTGDDVLCEVARMLVAGCREYDTVGRIGGEEFLIVSPTAEGAGEPTHFERIRAAIAEASIPTRTGMHSITISIGVATATAKSRGDIDALLNGADEALYRAKEAGRNRVMYSEEPL